MASDATTPGEPGGEPGEFAHLDERGQARMVDVGAKPMSERSARARARVELGAELRARFLGGRLGKGDGPAVARIAGISAAKDTARLIPLCHTIQLSSVAVEIGPGADEDGVEIIATAKARGVTGVEMEALTAASVAALAVYDMCKALRRDIRIGPIELLEKTGGVRGDWRRVDGAT
ncbi:MAG: cyclic pyranopterin monophosphate synthase MoaC [Planctomycetes bacterium]|nr:cyclic pyranopterin monophosphate synthase MoaC [Planctomycetota bacterium]